METKENVTEVSFGDVEELKKVTPTVRRPMTAKMLELIEVDVVASIKENQKSGNGNSFIVNSVGDSEPVNLV